MSERRFATIQVIVATWLFSFVGPLAKLLPLSAGAIAFWRGVFGVVALICFAAMTRVQVSRVWRYQHALALLATGLLTAGNWYFYVLAAKISTVAVAVVVLFTYPLFTALLEPWVFRERFRWHHVAGGLVVLAGILLLTPTFSLSDSTTLGALCALVASLSFTCRNLVSRHFVQLYPATTVMLYQMMACVVLFAPAGLSAMRLPSLKEFMLLFILGFGLTAISQTLFIASLRRLTTSYSSLLVSMQPLYTTAIAIPMLGEVPTRRTIAGGLVILVAVVFSMVMNAQVPNRR